MKKFMKTYLAIFAVLAFAVLLFGCLNSQPAATDSTQQTQNTQQIIDAPLPEDNLNTTIQDAPQINPNDYDKLN